MVTHFSGILCADNALWGGSERHSMLTHTTAEELPPFLLCFKLAAFGPDAETSLCPGTCGLALVWQGSWAFTVEIELFAWSVTPAHVKLCHLKLHHWQDLLKKSQCLAHMYTVLSASDTSVCACSGPGISLFPYFKQPSVLISADVFLGTDSREKGILFLVDKLHQDCYTMGCFSLSSKAVSSWRH